MQKIFTAQAAPGMILAKDVETPEGRILCGKGTPLDENVITRLKKMDINYICVQGHPVDVEGEKNLEQELSELEKRFSRVMDIPPLKYLKNCIAEQIKDSRG